MPLYLYTYLSIHPCLYLPLPLSLNHFLHSFLSPTTGSLSLSTTHILGRMIPWRGGLPCVCTLRYLAATLASTRVTPIAHFPHPQLWQPKMSSDTDKRRFPPGGKTGPGWETLPSSSHRSLCNGRYLSICGQTTLGSYLEIIHGRAGGDPEAKPVVRIRSNMCSQ